MNRSDETAPGTDPSNESGAIAIPSTLKPRFERLRMLRSAWSALAPAGFKVGGQNLVETGRAFGSYLGELAEKGREPDQVTLDDADERLDALAATMRQVAEAVPTSELRTAMPDSVVRDRAGVLDLLDLLIEGGDRPSQPISARIASIDFLLTLLCTGGQGHTIRHDPVTLTPSMHAFCSEIEQHGENDERVVEVESEFFAAANLGDEELRQEIALRQLRGRKVDLGLLYFAPRVLRAIVTYNAVFVERMADEVWNSTDWGEAVDQIGTSPAGEASGTSVFSSEPLRELAAALRRRASSEAPQPNDLDRVAWCLDLDYPNDVERKSLMRADAGTRSNVLGTTILVGLVSRSLAVLSIELQSIGISPDDVADRWVGELGDLLQSESDTLLAKNAYQQACVLSDLKNKFLRAPLTGETAPRVVPARPTGPAPPADSGARWESARTESEPTRESARDLVRDALGEQTSSANARRSKADVGARGLGGVFESLPWKQIVPAVAAVVALGFGLLQVFGGRMTDPDLDRFSRGELEQFSPHLTRGYRNGEGEGRAFVGVLERAWLDMPPAERAAAAEELVRMLRVRGMNQIMIYDGSEQLRIQAVGRQPVRTL